MLVCKGRCQLMPHKKHVSHAAEKGYKRCSKCLVFIQWEGVFCPCCGQRLKMSPRNNKSRQSYREMKLENIL